MFTFDIISGHAHKQPSPSYLYHCNKCDMRNLHQQTFIVFAPICSISTGPTFYPWEVNTAFQSAETGKYATPTGKLNFHFAPLAVSYEIFPQ